MSASSSTVGDKGDKVPHRKRPDKGQGKGAHVFAKTVSDFVKNYLDFVLLEVIAYGITNRRMLADS